MEGDDRKEGKTHGDEIEEVVIALDVKVRKYRIAKDVRMSRQVGRHELPYEKTYACGDDDGYEETDGRSNDISTLREMRWGDVLGEGFAPYHACHLSGWNSEEVEGTRPP